MAEIPHNPAIETLRRSRDFWRDEVLSLRKFLEDDDPILTAAIERWNSLDYTVDTLYEKQAEWLSVHPVTGD